MLKIFYTGVWWFGLASLVACGGGATGTGQGPTADDALVDSVSNSDNQVASSDTIDLVKTWNQWTTLGYKRDASLRIFWTKDWGTMPLVSEVVSVDTANGRSNLRITHAQHGAQTGDQLSWSNLSKTIHGEIKTSFETTHRITYLDDDHYLIAMPTLLTVGDRASFSARTRLKYLECVGTQLLEQGPARTETPPIFFKGKEASQAMGIATTKLQSCSPNESSITTYKYYDHDNVGLQLPLGQDIVGGTFSMVDAFALPNSSLKSGDKGELGLMTNFSDRTRRQIEGTTRMTYEVQRHTAQSVFLVIQSENIDISGLTRSITRDWYGKSPAGSGSDYNLMRSTVSYNNARKTEVVLDYTANLTELEPSYRSGSGSLKGGTPGSPKWQFFAINAAPFKFGGTLKVEITLGPGQSAASYDLFVTSSPPVTAEGRPLGSLANAYDAAPGSKTTLTYNFSGNKVKTYFLGVQGSWTSPSSATNTYTFEAWVTE